MQISPSSASEQAREEVERRRSCRTPTGRAARRTRLRSIVEVERVQRLDAAEPLGDAVETNRVMLMPLTPPPVMPAEEVPLEDDEDGDDGHDRHHGGRRQRTPLAAVEAE